MQPTIILLSPPTGYYAYVLSGLARAFQALGYPCAWHNNRLDFELLIPMIKKFNVVACLDINRVLPRGVPWPRDVAHLAWIQDYRFDDLDLTGDLGASHHLYFFMEPSVFGLHLSHDRSWSLLLPGARGDVPARGGVEMRRDLGFAGYIPPPVPDDLPLSTMPDGSPVGLATFLKLLPPDILHQSQMSVSQIRAAVQHVCNTIGCLPISEQSVVWNKDHYDTTFRIFDEFLVRTIERKIVVEGIIKVGGSLDIFGPATWRQWPQFAPFYRGNIVNPPDLDPVFQSTRINIHNGGMSMHHRVMDCLAAGGFLLVNETPRDFDAGGIRRYLEPDLHYGCYAIEDVATVARHYLADSEGRARIAAEGRREILASHTWLHRAAQVLNDLNLPIPARPAVAPARGIVAAQPHVEAALV